PCARRILAGAPRRYQRLKPPQQSKTGRDAAHHMAARRCSTGFSPKSSQVLP
ncbi:hypothetical protein A2U01_0063392, partial [Trifolium medium]|nr:hypothetical protein [Trifolium medium]